MPNNDFIISDGVLLKYTGKEETVVIPEGVVEIANRALADMMLAKTLILPSSLRKINSGAIAKNVYGYDYRLEKVVVPSLDVWLQIDFEGGFPSEASNFLDQAENLYIGDRLLTELTVPASAGKVRKYAFCDCKSLRKVTIEEGVTEIEEYAFAYSEIDELVLPQSLKTIGKGAFEHCKNLRSVVIPSGVEALPCGVFSGCASLASIELNEGLKTIEPFAIDGCAITELHLPETLNTFSISSCAHLPKIDLPANLEEIGQIIRCPLVEELYIPDSVRLIGKIGLTGAKKIRLPEELDFHAGFCLVASSGFSVVEHHAKLWEKDDGAPDPYNRYADGLYLGNEKNPYLAFVGIEDKNLKELVLHEDTKYISAYAVEDYRASYGEHPELSLEKVVIPAGIEWIPSCAFSSCPSLKTVVLSGNPVTDDYFVNKCPRCAVDTGGLSGKEISFRLREERYTETVRFDFLADRYTVTDDLDGRLEDGTPIKQHCVLEKSLQFRRARFLADIDRIKSARDDEKSPENAAITAFFPGEKPFAVAPDEEILSFLGEQTDFYHRIFQREFLRENQRKYTGLPRNELPERYASLSEEQIEKLLPEAKKSGDFIETEWLLIARYKLITGERYI